jgi:uncharacterized protein with FMN-binding domain
MLQHLRLLPVLQQHKLLQYKVLMEPLVDQALTLTVKDGKIVDATALQAPSGRNDRWTNMALPILKKQTLTAQSANIQGASGASYTSYGWYTSLQGALAKAGL